MSVWKTWVSFVPHTMSLHWGVRLGLVRNVANTKSTVFSSDARIVQKKPTSVPCVTGRSKNSPGLTTRYSKHPKRCFLLLPFFENDVFAGFGVVFFEFDLARDELLILARPIDLWGTLGLQLYELILRHRNQLLVISF